MQPWQALQVPSHCQKIATVASKGLNNPDQRYLKPWTLKHEAGCQSLQGFGSNFTLGLRVQMLHFLLHSSQCNLPHFFKLQQPDVFAEGQQEIMKHTTNSAFFLVFFFLTFGAFLGSMASFSKCNTLQSGFFFRNFPISFTIGKRNGRKNL